MAQPSKIPPRFTTVTYRVKSKPRFTLIDDPVLLGALQAAAVVMNERPRLRGVTTGELVGVFALRTNNVLELYRTKDGRELGVLFTSIDVWMTYESGVDGE